MPKSRNRNKPKKHRKGLDFARLKNRPLKVKEQVRTAAAPREMIGQFRASGLGGQKQELVSVYADADGNNLAQPAGGTGAYTVTFLLQKPGYSLFGEREFRFGLKTGDSHVMLGNPRAEVHMAIDVDGINAQIVGQANQRGALAALTMRIQAAGFKAAKEMAYRLVTPTLSHWSAIIDVPVEIARIELLEEATGSRQMSVTNPFRDSTLQTAVNAEGATTGDLRVFLSYYREALNSSSDPYALLCLYKIIEGVRILRVREARAAASAGLPAPAAPPPEIIPTLDEEFVPWLKKIFPHRADPWEEIDLDSVFIQEARGLAVDDLVRVGGRNAPPGLLCALRNEVAHTISGAGVGTLIADESLHVVRVTRWLPLTKCIARLLLLHQFPTETWRQPAPPPLAPPAAPDQAAAPANPAPPAVER
jgi:hypothetical protein